MEKITIEKKRWNWTKAYLVVMLDMPKAKGEFVVLVDEYKGGKRPVTLVGINFRTAKRNIDEPIFSLFDKGGKDYA